MNLPDLGWDSDRGRYRTHLRCQVIPPPPLPPQDLHSACCRWSCYWRWIRHACGSNRIVFAMRHPCQRQSRMKMPTKRLMTCGQRCGPPLPYREPALLASQTCFPAHLHHPKGLRPASVVAYPIPPPRRQGWISLILIASQCHL